MLKFMQLTAIGYKAADMSRVVLQMSNHWHCSAVPPFLITAVT